MCNSRENGHVISVGLWCELEARVDLDGANLELVGRQGLPVRVEDVVA